MLFEFRLSRLMEQGNNLYSAAHSVVKQTNVVQWKNKDFIYYTAF